MSLDNAMQMQCNAMPKPQKTDFAGEPEYFKFGGLKNELKNSKLLFSNNSVPTPQSHPVIWIPQQVSGDRRRGLEKPYPYQDFKPTLINSRKLMTNDSCQPNGQRSHINIYFLRPIYLEPGGYFCSPESFKSHPESFKSHRERGTLRTQGAFKNSQDDFKNSQGCKNNPQAPNIWDGGSTNKHRKRINRRAQSKIKIK
jgi:hypothetical protein